MKKNKTDLLVKFDHVCFEVSGRKILDNICLEIKQNQIITVMGPNGGGKSTLAKLLAGIYKPHKGNISYHKDVKIGYMPQKLVINANIPINVKYFLSISSNQTEDKIQNIASRLGITKLLNSPISNLSVGELQRTSLARTLLEEPDILVLDEPEQGVDLKGQLEIYQLLLDIHKQDKKTIFMIAHDFHFVIKSTSHVICLNHHICCEGEPEQLNKNQDYVALFGKDAAKIISIYSHHHDHEHIIAEDHNA